MLLNIAAPPADSASVGPTELSLSARGRVLAGAVRSIPDPDRRAFQAGLPAFDEFPFSTWSRLLMRHSRKPAPELLGYGQNGGHPALRHAISDYLGAARGVNCSPDQVVVIGSAQAGLDLVSRMLLDPGDTAWIEEPGYPGARGALLGAGARLHPVPVDDDGLDVAAGERVAPRARLAYVTPSYQFPLGTTMSLERRLRLLEWAQRANAWVIEDDYDSEYRYRGRPLSALQGLDTAERVIYVGTFSKTMFPALRLAYLVVPRGLVQVFRRALRHTGQDAPLAIQAAAADFISEGHYASHLRRTRALYAERLQRFSTLLMEQLGHVLELGPVDAGMQFPVYLPHSMDDREIARRAEEAGVSIAALSTFYLRECPQPGLLLGYAAVPEAEMRKGVDILHQLIPVAEARAAAF